MAEEKREIVVRDIMTTVTADISGNSDDSNVTKKVNLEFTLEDISGNESNSNYVDPVIISIRIQSRGSIDDYNDTEVNNKDEALHFRRDVDGNFLESEYLNSELNFVIVNKVVQNTNNNSIDYTIDPLMQCVQFVVSKNKPIHVELEMNNDNSPSNLQKNYKLIITKINNGTNIISSVHSYRHQLKIEGSVDGNKTSLSDFVFSPLKSIENLLLEAKSFAKNTIDSYNLTSSDVVPEKYYGTHLGVTTMITDTRDNSNKITEYTLNGNGEIQETDIDLSGFIMAYKYNRLKNTYGSIDFSYNSTDVSENKCALFDADIFNRDVSSNNNKMFNQYVMCYEVPKSVNADVSVYQGKTVHYVKIGGINRHLVSTGITYTYVPGEYLKQTILNDNNNDILHQRIDDTKNYSLVIGSFDFPSDVSNIDPQYQDINSNGVVDGVIEFGDTTLRPNAITTNNNYKQRAHSRYGIVYDDETYKSNTEDAVNGDKFLERINNFADVTITLNGHFNCSENTKIQVGDTFDVSFVYLDKGVSGLDSEKVTIQKLFHENLSYLLPSTVVMKDSLLTNGLYCILARQISSNSVNSNQYKVVDVMRHKIDSYLSTTSSTGDKIVDRIANDNLTRILVFEPNMRNGIHMNTLEPIMILYDTYKREISNDDPTQPGNYAGDQTGLIDLTVKLDDDPFMWQDNIIEISKAYNSGQTSMNGIEGTVISYTQNEGIKLMYSFIENLEIYRSGQITLIKNGIAEAKLGGFENFIETGEANNVNMNETITEIPGLHLGVYITYSLYNTSTNELLDNYKERVYYRKGLDSDAQLKFDTMMTKLNNISIHCYDQNLQIGDGTTNSFQNEQVIDINNKFVTSVLDNGSKSRKYSLGTYYENSIIVNSTNGAKFVPIIKPNNVNNIALQDQNVNDTGMIVFTNINVPYEKHNGVTIKFHDTLENLKDISYLIPDDISGDQLDGVSIANVGVQNVTANVVICSKETNDILGKMGVDMTDPISMSYLISSRKVSKEVSKNNFLVSSQEVNIFKRDLSGTEVTEASSSDFIVSVKTNKDGVDSSYNVQRDVHMNLIIDMFRSTTTTLVAPVVVLNKVRSIDQMRQYIIDEGIQVIGTAEDVAKNYMSVHRIRYDNDFDKNNDISNGEHHPSSEFTTNGSGITLNKMFYPDGAGNSNLYTIIRSNPAYVIGSHKGNDDALNKLTQTGIFTNDNINTFQYIDDKICGHKGVFVETLYILTNVLGNLLTDEGDTLDNLFWYLSDENNDTVFSKVPSTIFNPNQNHQSENFISAKTYRKAITGVLYETTKSTIETFVDYYRNVQIPPRWMKTGEVYDGYYGLELLRYFAYTLMPFYEDENSDLSGSKIPIVIEDTGDYISFVDVGYHGESFTQYRRISKAFVKTYLGEENYNKYIVDEETRVFYTVNDSAMGYVKNLKSFINYGKELAKQDTEYNTNEQLENLWTELEKSNQDTDGNANDSIKGENQELFIKYNIDDEGEVLQPLHRYTVLVLESLYLISRYGNSNLKEIGQRITSVSIKNNIYYDFFHTRIIGSSVNNLKNRYEKIPFTVELSTRRIPRNLLMEATSFRLSEITLVNNSLLREVILDNVGAPIDMVAPIVLDLNTQQIDTVVNRDIKFDTDYLIEVNNRLDKNRLMNQIFYVIRNGERKIVRVGKTDKLDYLIGPDYQPITKTASGTDSRIGPEDIGGIANENTLSNDLTELLMCPGDTNTSIAELIQHTEYGQLKLANVKDDKTVRGILRDYRYHGVGEDVCGNPIFADDVPYMSGGLGMQVARMISSGLVNKQNDVYIISNRNQVVNNIRHPSPEHLGLEQYTENSGYVSTIAKYIDEKLKEQTSTEFPVSQFLLEQLYLKDPLRFQVNEIARNSITDAELNNNLVQGDEIMYMLPLTEDDTFSIASVVKGFMNDPYESKSDTLSSILNAMNSKSLSSNISSVSLTGTPIMYDEDNNIKPADSKGTFFNSNNLFYFSEFGPYEKYIVDSYDICNGEVCLLDKNGDQLPDSLYDKNDVNIRLESISETIRKRINKPSKDTSYNILNIGDKESMKSIFNEHYLALRERSFHIRYLLKDDHNQLSYENLNDNQTANLLYNETNDPTQMSNFLGNVDFTPTIIWMPRKIGDETNEITQYNIPSLNSNNNIGQTEDSHIYLSSGETPYDQVNGNTFNKSYDSINESNYEYKNNDKTFNIIRDYIQKLNSNPFTDIDIFTDLYFKIKLQVPITELSVDNFISVAKYIRQNATGVDGIRNHPKIKLLEHSYQISEAMLVGDENKSLQNATNTLIKSNKQNVYKTYSSNVENETQNKDDDIGHIFVKETSNFNIVDIVILSLFYNQLSLLGKTGGNKRIGKNEFYASIEKVVPVLAYQNIYVSMEFIDQQLKEWEESFKNQYNDLDLFPISLQQYILLLQKIVYNSYFVLRYLDSVENDIQSDRSDNKETIDSVNQEYLTSEITRVRNTITNNIENNATPQGPFDIRYYHKMFLRNERYPEWRFKNLPSSITKKMGLTVDELHSINKSSETIDEQRVHVLWRVDMIWNLRVSDTSEKEGSGFDISLSGLDNGAESDYLFKELLDRVELRKNYTEEGNLKEFTTWKEAFLYQLFDTSFIPDEEKGADSLTIQDQNNIYRLIRDKPRTGGNLPDDFDGSGDGSRSADTQDSEWMWQLCLDTIFDDSRWKWPFNMHIFEYAPQSVLHEEYKFVVGRLQELSSANVQHPLIDLTQVQDLQTKLNDVDSSGTYSIYKTEFTNSIEEQECMYGLKQSEYDGFFYSNDAFINIVEQKMYSDSNFKFISNDQYASDRNDMLEDLTEILEKWKERKNNV